MTLPFLILSALTLLGALAAMTLRNLVHCALCLTVAFAGLAALYVQLGAEFVGFAQVLVYIGAVAILIVFAILLTGGGETGPRQIASLASWGTGVAAAVAVFICLISAIQSSGRVPRWSTLAPAVTVRMIGEQLLDRRDGKPESYVLPLLLTGILLTAALIGGVLIAMQEKKDP